MDTGILNQEKHQKLFKQSEEVLIIVNKDNEGIVDNLEVKPKSNRLILLNLIIVCFALTTISIISYGYSEFEYYRHDSYYVYSIIFIYGSYTLLFTSFLLSLIETSCHLYNNADTEMEYLYDSISKEFLSAVLSFCISILLLFFPIRAIFLTLVFNFILAILSIYLINKVYFKINQESSCFISNRTYLTTSISLAYGIITAWVITYYAYNFFFLFFRLIWNKDMINIFTAAINLTLITFTYTVYRIVKFNKDLVFTVVMMLNQIILIVLINYWSEFFYLEMLQIPLILIPYGLSIIYQLFLIAKSYQ